MGMSEFISSFTTNKLIKITIINSCFFVFGIPILEMDCAVESIQSIVCYFISEKLEMHQAFQ
jgi:hypothetical protein